MRTPPSIRPTLRGKVLGVLFSLVITLAMFLSIPLTQIASEYVQNSRSNEDRHILVAPPPKVELQPVVEEEKTKMEEEDIKLDKEFEPIDLSLLDLALNVGNGNATDGVGIYVGNFEVDESEFDVDLNIFEIHQLDKAPFAIQQIAPFYPNDMKRQYIEGSVIAECIVTDTGDVKRIRITKSTRKEFELPVINALRRWQFNPGVKDDKDVYTHVRIPFYFNLNDTKG